MSNQVTAVSSAHTAVLGTASALESGKLVLDLGGSERVSTSVLQPDGKLLVAGMDGNKMFVARFNADGGIDTTFAVNGQLTDTAADSKGFNVAAIDVQADGKLVLAGREDDQLTLRRYNADGAVDSGFGANGTARYLGSDLSLAQELNIGSDGSLLVAGLVDGVPLDTGQLVSGNQALVRFDSDGQLDSSFATGGVASVATGRLSYGRDVIQQSDGKYLLIGHQEFLTLERYFFTEDGDLQLSRLNADGSIDTSFGDNGTVVTDLAFVGDSSVTKEIIHDAVMLANGQIIVLASQYDDLVLVRYNSDGSLDTNFADQGALNLGVDADYDQLGNISLQPDGKILVSSTFEWKEKPYLSDGSNPGKEFAIYRLDSDGNLDESFGASGRAVIGFAPDSTDFLTGHQLQADGSILLTGYSNDDIAVIRLDSSGELDASFAVKAETVQTETVSGIDIETRTGTDARGNATTTTTIAPVSELPSGQSSLDVSLRDTGAITLSASLSDQAGVSAVGAASAKTQQSITEDLHTIVHNLTSFADADAALDEAGRFFSVTGSSSNWLTELTLSAGSSQATNTIISSSSISSTDATQVLIVSADETVVNHSLQLEKAGFVVADGDLRLSTDNSDQWLFGLNGNQAFSLGSGNDKAFGGAGDDSIEGGAGNDWLNGGAGDDVINAAAGDDRLYGEAGNDILRLGAGNQVVIGGVGSDTAQFDGNLSDYNIAQQHAVVYVSRKDTPSETSTLINVEQLSFADQSTAVGYSDNQLAIATLYQQILGRDADLSGLQYWSQAMDSGMQLGDTALAFLRSTEYSFKTHPEFDNKTAAEQIEELYLGMLGRASDSAGKAHWLEQLNNGAQLINIASAFAVSEELSANYVQADTWNFDVTGW